LRPSCSEEARNEHLDTAVWSLS